MMEQMVEISQITMRRLLNYQRVVDNEAQAAITLQWKTMTLDNMRRAEAAKRRATRIGAIVAYSSCLFRIQHRMPPYRLLRDDYHLHNGLVALMNELGIATHSIDVEIASDTVGN